jgi:hypothetical protein
LCPGNGSARGIAVRVIAQVFLQQSKQAAGRRLIGIRWIDTGDRGDQPGRSPGALCRGTGAYGIAAVPLSTTLAVAGRPVRLGMDEAHSCKARLRSGASNASSGNRRCGSDGVSPAVPIDAAASCRGWFGSTGRISGKRELTLRTGGDALSDAAGARPLHQSPMPLPSPIWPTLPGKANGAVGADAPRAPKSGVGDTGALGLAAADAAPAPPKTPDRNSPGTANGPKFRRCSGAKCNGGSIGSAAGAELGETRRCGRDGGTRGLGPSGPPVDVGPSASGMAMPGASCGVDAGWRFPGGGTLPGRDGRIDGDRGDDVVGAG